MRDRHFFWTPAPHDHRNNLTNCGRSMSREAFLLCRRNARISIPAKSNQQQRRIIFPTSIKPGQIESIEFIALQLKPNRVVVTL